VVTQRSKRKKLKISLYISIFSMENQNDKVRFLNKKEQVIWLCKPHEWILDKYDNISCPPGVGIPITMRDLENAINKGSPKPE
jgi:hypothetical protein